MTSDDAAVRPVLLTRTAYHDVLAEAWRVYPLEACGLFLGSLADNSVSHFVPIVNAAQSSKIFQLDPLGHMKAERFADDDGLDVVGIVHSHTHTSAFPSPTDVAEATKPLVSPQWKWAIVSLADGYPVLRSYRIGPHITEQTPGHVVFGRASRLTVADVAAAGGYDTPGADSAGKEKSRIGIAEEPLLLTD